MILFYVHVQFDEGSLVLRTREQHLLDCDTLEADDVSPAATSTQLGINYRSILFELQRFEVDLLVPDVMHDLLEGTLQFEAKLVLEHVVSERYVSYSVFAGALAGMEVGYMEADNKPSEISSATFSSSDKTLGQKGSNLYIVQVTIFTCMYPSFSL